MRNAIRPLSTVCLLAIPTFLVVYTLWTLSSFLP